MDGRTEGWMDVTYYNINCQVRIHLLEVSELQAITKFRHMAYMHINYND
jgi:hypothetical protein